METHLPNKFLQVHQKCHMICRMGQHNLTNQWTDLVAQHLKCCYGHSEMPEQSLSSKYFCIIASRNLLHDRIPKQQASTSESNDRIYCALSAHSGVQVIYYILYENYYIQWPLPLFFILIFSACLSGSDDFVFFDSLDGNGAYLQMFYATLEFCAQVKFATLDGNPATENQSITGARFLYTGPSSPWSQNWTHENE